MNQLMIAILVGLISVFCILDSRILGRLNFEQPLITSTLVGLVLGNIEMGLMIGATIELVALGVVSVGASSPPDITLGGIIATTLCIMSGANPESALALTIPIAVLGQMLGIAFRTVLSNLTHLADAAIEKGKFKQAVHLHILWGNIFYALMYFIPTFLAIYFGSDYVQALVSAIPDWLTNGLTLAGKLLTAYGLALLLSIMLTPGKVKFFFLGFFLVAYLQLPITAIAIFSLVIALVVSELKFRGVSLFARTNKASNTTANKTAMATAATAGAAGLAGASGAANSVGVKATADFDPLEDDYDPLEED